MSGFERRIDDLFDKSFEDGLKGLTRFFSGVKKGAKSLNKPENKKKFILNLLIFMALSVLLELYIKIQGIDKYKVINILYELPFPWPTGFLSFIVTGIFLNLYILGQKQSDVQKKLLLAFERAGLYSRRKIYDQDSNKTKPEYPSVYKEHYHEDGGLVFIFKNPGIPLEDWEKAIPSIEATLQEKISQVNHFKNNPGLIEMKIGGSELPTELKYEKDMITNLSPSQVFLGVDKDTNGIIHDFKKVPHLLIAGITGSGKSVELRFIAYQTLEQQGANLWAIDFKGGIEFEPFEPLGVECVWDREKALDIINYLQEEHHARIELFREEGVKNIDEYNKNSDDDNKMKRCYLAIDELAELTDPTGVPPEEKELFLEIEGGLSSLARLSRATGIHLLLATQRPDAKVITGQIKNNVGGRICGYMSDMPASQLVISSPKATKIENTGGRFLYSTGNKITEFQAPYFQDAHMDKGVKNDYSTGMLINYYEYLENTSSTPSLRRKKRMKRI